MSDPTRTHQPPPDPTPTPATVAAPAPDGDPTRTHDPSTLPEHPGTRTHDPLGETASGPAVGSSAAATPPAAGSLLADRYRLVRVIGEGGMGSVWLAEQTHPVRRQVAVKLILAGRDSKAVLARFEAERQALAVMDHPHIAKVLDAGTTAAGQPFFVMERVNGPPLNRFADEHKLTLAQRLDLFQLVCHAVQHAHQKGIIHRDLKPGNVLVETVDGKPAPKVIDFGLAKALTGPRLTDASADLTGFGSVLGTPLYMAPEQADPGGAVDVDTRADVYALGVVLYELLTGTTPIPRARIQKLTMLEVLRLIREEEPPTPRRRLSELRSTTAAPGGSTDVSPPVPRALHDQELDWIVMKALAKERERRYQSAAALAEDVARHRRHEPVQAGPPTAGYKLRKFVRRNRPQVIAAGLVLAALVAGVVGTAVGLVEARMQRDAADLARRDEEKQRRAAEQERDDKELARKDAVTQKEEAERANALSGRVLDAMTSVAAGDALTSQAVVSPEQRKFLTQAVEYYQQLAAKRGNDPVARKRTAEAATQLGSIQWRLGNKKEAVTALEQACDLFTAFAADRPDDPDAARTVHRAHSNLGIAYADAGRGPDAERAYAPPSTPSAAPPGGGKPTRSTAVNWPAASTAWPYCWPRGATIGKPNRSTVRL